jgi:hypothetical protein
MGQHLRTRTCEHGRVKQSMVIAGEFTDLRSSGSHQGLAFVLFVAGVVAIVALAVVVAKAVQARSLRRAAWLILGAALGLLMVAPLPLVMNVSIAAPATQCGLPVLSRPDIQRDLQQPEMASTAEHCIRAFSHERGMALGLLLAAVVLVAGAAGLFALDTVRHGHRLVGPRPRIVDSPATVLERT